MARQRGAQRALQPGDIISAQRLAPAGVLWKKARGGEPEQVAGLARFMVAELAVNKWAEGCEVLLADQFAAETVRLNPARLRQVERSDALARAAVLTGESWRCSRSLPTAASAGGR